MIADDTRPRIEPTPELIARLPKTGRHVHLDGSLRLTIIELTSLDWRAGDRRGRTGPAPW